MASAGSLESITLYGAHISHLCNAVAIALMYKQLPFQLVEPPGSGWHEERKRFKVGYGTEAYRQVMRPIPPTIPAIVAKWGDGKEFKLNESATIIEWLDDVAPSLPKLLPGDAEARARLRLVIRVHDLSLDSKVRSLFSLIDPASRSEDELAEKLNGVQEVLVVIAGFCDSYASDSACDIYFNGVQLTAPDCTLFPTFVLLDRMILVIKKEAMKWPGTRLPKWYAAFADHPAAKVVMDEAVVTISDWVRRKSLGQSAFTDGWWRPKEYGGKRNACFPSG